MSQSSESVTAVVYTKPGCPFCSLAINLLKSKNVDFEVIDALASEENMQSFRDNCKGAKTFPQVIINGRLIGGYDNLSKLDEDGALQEILDQQ